MCLLTQTTTRHVQRTDADIRQESLVGSGTARFTYTTTSSSSRIDDPQQSLTDDDDNDVFTLLVVHLLEHEPEVVVFPMPPMSTARQVSTKHSSPSFHAFHISVGHLHVRNEV